MEICHPRSGKGIRQVITGLVGWEVMATGSERRERRARRGGTGEQKSWKKWEQKVGKGSTLFVLKNDVWVFTKC